MRIKTFFQWSHLIFCNLNIVALSTINVETHGGSELFDLWWLSRTGQSGLHAWFFDSAEHGAWMQGTALEQIGWCRIPTAMANKQVKVWWLFGSEGWAVKVWWFMWCQVWPMLVVGCYFLSCPVKPTWNDVWNKWLINGTSVSHFLQPSARNPQFLEYSCIF